MNVRSFKKSFGLLDNICFPQFWRHITGFSCIYQSLHRSDRPEYRTVLISFSSLMSHFSSMKKQIYALFILNLFSLEIYTLKESNKIQKTLLDRTYFFFLLFFPKFFISLDTFQTFRYMWQIYCMGHRLKEDIGKNTTF